MILIEIPSVLAALFLVALIFLALAIFIYIIINIKHIARETLEQFGLKMKIKPKKQHRDYSLRIKAMKKFLHSESYAFVQKILGIIEEKSKIAANEGNFTVEVAVYDAAPALLEIIVSILNFDPRFEKVEILNYGGHIATHHSIKVWW